MCVSLCLALLAVMVAAVLGLEVLCTGLCPWPLVSLQQLGVEQGAGQYTILEFNEVLRMGEQGMLPCCISDMHRPGLVVMVATKVGHGSSRAEYILLLGA